MMAILTSVRLYLIVVLICISLIEIRRIVRNYYAELYAKKFENLGEMDTFLEKYNLPKLKEEEAESLNRLITADKIEAVIKKLPAHKSPGLDNSQENFTKHLEKS